MRAALSRGHIMETFSGSSPHHNPIMGSMWMRTSPSGLAPCHGERTGLPAPRTAAFLYQMHLFDPFPLVSLGLLFCMMVLQLGMSTGPYAAGLEWSHCLPPFKQLNG